MAKPSPNMALAVNSVHEALCTLSALRWAARVAQQDGYDGMTAFNQLAIAALPSAGRMLEACHLALNGAEVGFFPESEVTHVR